ncbi:MAG: hypothetical protein QFX40_04880 [Archaeoglobales archaeon]|nr:hypothetical protein [Archaeoglobales archaeon]
MMLVDRKNNLLIIKRRSVITGRIKFGGKVVVGLGSIILGDIEAEQVSISKNCSVRCIKCQKVVVGAFSNFGEIEAEDVKILSNCKGERIKGNLIKISKGCRFEEVYGDIILIEGETKIRKLEGRKIIALPKT